MTFADEVPPPAILDGATVLAWAWSGARRFGAVSFPSGEVAHEVHGLALAGYAGDERVYRFACDRAWEVVQDAEYASVEEAKRLLPAQYREIEAHWHSSSPDETA